MQGNVIEDRVNELAQYIIASRDTVRGAAKRFGISKSTVHKDVTERLKKMDRNLFYRVKEIMDEHKDERHIRGGKATKEKYEKLRGPSD